MKLDFLRYMAPFTRYPYKGEIVPCPVCATKRASRVANTDRRFKRISTFACDHCGLLYTNPMPTESELIEYYSTYYRLDYQGARDAPKPKHLMKRAAEAERRAVQVCRFLVPNARTLDFGCGSGEFVTAMCSRGHDAYGFEPGQAYGNYAKAVHGERIKVQGWQDVAFDAHFDLVTCFHVLEHLRNPMDALKKIAEWVKPTGGLVYLEVPNMGAINPNKGLGALHYAHVIGFNHHNLLLAAALNGLQPKFIVSPTGIIFEPGNNADLLAVADQGKELTAKLYGNNRPVYNYLRYQLGKVRPWRPSVRVSQDSQ